MLVPNVLGNGKGSGISSSSSAGSIITGGLISLTSLLLDCSQELLSYLQNKD